MNFEQVVADLGELRESRTLEIGYCYDYYFLNKFKNNQNDCFGFNIHFDLTNEEEYKLWPKKKLGDINC